jgi:hypothetical protein
MWRQCSVNGAGGCFIDTLPQSQWLELMSQPSSWNFTWFSSNSLSMFTDLCTMSQDCMEVKWGLSTSSSSLPLLWGCFSIHGILQLNHWIQTDDHISLYWFLSWFHMLKQQEIICGFDLRGCFDVPKTCVFLELWGSLWCRVFYGTHEVSIDNLFSTCQRACYYFAGILGYKSGFPT